MVVPSQCVPWVLSLTSSTCTPNLHTFAGEGRTNDIRAKYGLKGDDYDNAMLSDQA